MGYKNRKSDYPLYPTVYFDNIRDMLAKTAEKYADRTAISYRIKPKDGKSVSDANEIKEKDIIKIKMRNGNVDAEVKKIEQD